ncbi:G2 and S phase-expressed protein 1-like isoform X2 [Ptychodera flava]|uniref:G2 and S phase-expressed protein 1-like isoform X2 n=1 Tax=Ptychodera flava TaxID=63121 RepID=UPI00396A46E6
MADVCKQGDNIGLLIDFGDLDDKTENPAPTTSESENPGCKTGLLLDLDDVFGSVDSDTKNSNNNNAVTDFVGDSQDKCESATSGNLNSNNGATTNDGNTTNGMENETKKNNWMCDSILSPTSEMQLIQNEVFDFDLPISPPERGKETVDNQTNVNDGDDNDDDDDDDEEVFFGPVGHKEKCIAVNHEIKQEEKEYKTLSPLSGEQYAEVFKEAITLSLFFEKCSIEEEKKKQKKSSTEDENLIVKLGKLTMKNKTQNLSPTKACQAVLDDQVQIKSPRSPRRETFVLEMDSKTSPRSPRRETYVVGLSSEHEMPPALQRKQKTTVKYQGSSMNQTRGLKPPQKSKLGTPSTQQAAVSKIQASPRISTRTAPPVHTFTAQSTARDCKQPAKRRSLQKPGSIAAKSKLTRPSKLVKPGTTNSKSPSANASKVYSPPKRKRLNSAGSEEAMSDTCSVASDTSDGCNLSISSGKRPLPVDRPTRPSGLRPPSMRSLSSTSSSASSNSSFHSLNDSVRDYGKKLGGLPVPAYKPSLIRPSSLQKKSAGVSRTNNQAGKMSSGSKLSKPQPMKAMIPIPHGATPGKIGQRGCVKSATPKVSGVTASTPKTREKMSMPKRLMGSSLSSVSSTDSIPGSASKLRSNSSMDSVFASTPPTPMNSTSGRSTVSATPKSVTRRRSNIPTPMRSASVKSRYGSNTSMMPPSPLSSPLSIRKPKHRASSSTNRSIVTHPPPKFSIDDDNDKHVENKENVRATDKTVKNSPAVDMLIDFNDSPFKRQSPLRSTMTITDPVIDFKSPVNSGNSSIL